LIVLVVRFLTNRHGSLHIGTGEKLKIKLLYFLEDSDDSVLVLIE
jgi:hypothetical protein